MDQIFGVDNFQNEVVWAYRIQGVGKKRWARKHETILFYSKSDRWTFNPPKERVYYEKPFYDVKKDDKGRYYRDVYIRDIWDDINALISISSELLGYPTQKPLKLLERIIWASSNEGDIVLDPFCGCGTALVAAQNLNRKWIGIDITHLAIALMRSRLKDKFGIDAKVIGEPKDLSGAKELAKQNRYQFQWWALSLIGARPYGDKKKGADTGIDGYYYFNDGGATKKAIVSVKSGHVEVSQVRDLIAVVERERASMGFFITLEQPTKPMFEEAVKKGFYKDSFGNEYPKVQILTIEEILNGKKPETPTKSPYQ